METEKLNDKAQLVAAYCAAWAEVQNATKNAHNPHFKSNYADLGSVLEVVKATFAKHGLAVYQAPAKIVALPGDALAISVLSILMHSSGGMLSIETQMPLGKNATAPAAGSATSYARRYALAAIAGITQVDDDGTATVTDGDEDLAGLIAAAKDAKDLKKLEAAVRASGDQGLGDAFVARRKELRKSAKE